jgi:hypothetical protein
VNREYIRETGVVQSVLVIQKRAVQMRRFPDEIERVPFQKGEIHEVEFTGCLLKGWWEG